MKNVNAKSGLPFLNWFLPRPGMGGPVLARATNLGLGLLLALVMTAQAAETAQTFATPESAAATLVAAVKAKDLVALRAIFGPGLRDVENPDRIQATNEFNKFAAALVETNRLVAEGAGKYVLEVGPDLWPFPIPLLNRAGRWVFDVEAGKEELLNRRIGRNELSTLEVVRTYVEAQREYASRDRDGDQVLEYAQQLVSPAGTKDGLYWSPELDGEISPIGPLVAQAQSEGYKAKSKQPGAAREPFHGYFFKILTRQGVHAPGGKYNYVINGNMIGGFGLVAWPAEYGESGIMTFLVNQQGRVYQKDLGAKTATQADRMDRYDPDSTWALSPN